jgi:hypothetical protein
MFDRRWNIASVQHPMQSQITAYQGESGQVVTFDYKWQDIDWKFR